MRHPAFPLFKSALLASVSLSLCVIAASAGAQSYEFRTAVPGLVAVPPPPVYALNASVSALDFGDIELGQASAVQSVLLQNTGTASLGLTAIGASAGYLAAHTCTTLAVLGDCFVNLQFSPTAEGALGGTLQVGSLAGLTSVGLTGRGVAAKVQYEDASGAILSNYSFAPVTEGTTSSPFTLTVRNVGTAALVFSAPGISIASPFHVTSATCANATLAPNTTCTITLVASPTAAATYGPSTPALSTNGYQIAAFGVSGSGTSSYATWSPASVTPLATVLSNNNLTVSQASSTHIFSYANVQKSSGKWYWEVTVDSANSSPAMIGISSSAVSTETSTVCWGCGGAPKAYWGVYTTAITPLGVWGGGFGAYAGATSGFGNTAGTVLGYALDASSGKLSVYSNCVFKGTFSGLDSGPWKPQISSGGNSALPVLTANFGASAFACAVPSGYTAGLR